MSQQTHQAKDERIFPATAPLTGRQMQMIVVPTFYERRIFLYLEVNLSVANAAFYLGAKIRTYRQGQPVSVFPAEIADFTGLTVNQSVASLFNAGGSPVGDSLAIRLAQPFQSAINSVVLQPLRVNEEIDLIALDFDSFTGPISGWRAYLACLSTKYL